MPHATNSRGSISVIFGAEDSRSLFMRARRYNYARGENERRLPREIGRPRRRRRRWRTCSRKGVNTGFFFFTTEPGPLAFEYRYDCRPFTSRFVPVVFPFVVRGANADFRCVPTTSRINATVRGAFNDNTLRLYAKDGLHCGSRDAHVFPFDRKCFFNRRGMNVFYIAESDGLQIAYLHIIFQGSLRAFFQTRSLN